MQPYRFSFCAVVGNGLKECPWRKALDNNIYKIHGANATGSERSSYRALFSSPLFTPHTQIFFILKLKAFNPNRHWLKWHHSRTYIRLPTAPSAGGFIQLCLHLQRCSSILTDFNVQNWSVWGEIHCELDASWLTLNSVNEVRASADTYLVDWISSVLSLINNEDKITQRKNVRQGMHKHKFWLYVTKCNWQNEHKKTFKLLGYHILNLSFSINPYAICCSLSIKEGHT